VARAFLPACRSRPFTRVSITLPGFHQHDPRDLESAFAGRTIVVTPVTFLPPASDAAMRPARVCGGFYEHDSSRGAHHRGRSCSCFEEGWRNLHPQGEPVADSPHSRLALGAVDRSAHRRPPAHYPSHFPVIMPLDYCLPWRHRPPRRAPEKTRVFAGSIRFPPRNLLCSNGIDPAALGHFS
jgi:hypothetical protein